MKRILYIPLLLLFYACSSEDAIVDNQATTVEVPFTVSISTKPESGQTKAVTIPPIAGNTTANTVKIYVFEDPNGSEDLLNPNPFFYKAEGIITENINGASGDYIAKGNFTASTGASYRIIALAYDSDKYGTALAESLFTVGTSFSAAMVTLQNKVTPELFAGYLRVKDGVSDVISKVDGTTELTGNLFRTVGYVSITLTNIPDDISSLTFVSQKFASTKSIYNIKTSDSRYPLWFVDETLKETYAGVSTVAKENFEGNTATLKSFFFPLGEINRTFFYIDVLKNGSSYPIRLQVKCADTKWEQTIWLGLFDKLVSSNSFAIPINWQLNLSGDYSTLASGNIKIDASPITDSVAGGVLTPLNP